MNWWLRVSLTLILEFATSCPAQEGARTRPSAASQISELNKKSVLGIAITAKDLPEEDRRRLNGGVERIIQKGATSPQELLEPVRSVKQSLGAKTGIGECC